MSSREDEDPRPDSLETTSDQDYNRIKRAYQIAMVNLTEKIDEIEQLKSQRSQLTITLEKALKLSEFLLTEMRIGGMTPSSQAVFTKAALDQAMSKLLGMTDARED